MKAGLQLYNFRNELAADFKGALREIAKIGFDGVEFAGNYGGIAPDELAAYLKELKLECEMLPMHFTDQPSNDYGRGTQLTCMAMKSRLLLYAASPQFNGNQDYAPREES